MRNEGSNGTFDAEDDGPSNESPRPERSPAAGRQPTDQQPDSPTPDETTELPAAAEPRAAFTDEGPDHDESAGDGSGIQTEAGGETPVEVTERAEPVVLRAADAGLRGSRGWAFRHVDLTARVGQVVAVLGPSGSGRSTLLLALAGRLRLTTGTITVTGTKLTAGRPRRAAARTARRAVAVARLAEHIGLDPDLTVATNLRDAADWAGIALWKAEDHLARWRERTGFDLDPRTPVGELSAVEATAAHLLLATLGEPAAIVLDDADHRLTAEQRPRFWTLARAVADTGPVVVAAGLDAPTEADVYVRLTAPPDPTGSPGPAESSELTTPDAEVEQEQVEQEQELEDAPGSHPDDEEGAR